MKTVRECYQTVSANADIVEPDTSIDEVIKVISRDTASRSVFVVDPKRGLVGIIRVRDILKFFGARYVNDFGLGAAVDFMAKKACHIMGSPYQVRLDDSLEDALRIAVQSELYDIPVVDNGKVVGNLDCLEIIMNYKPKAYGKGSAR